MNKILLVALGLAMAAAIGYFLLGIGVIHPGDLTGENGPPGFAWIMFGGYVVGGVLILLKKRGLWITGAAVNGLVVLMFIIMYLDQLDVLFSAPGLITKIAQIFLEAVLIYLIVKSGPEKSAVTAK